MKTIKLTDEDAEYIKDFLLAPPTAFVFEDELNEPRTEGEILDEEYAEERRNKGRKLAIKYFDVNLTGLAFTKSC